MRHRSTSMRQPRATAPAIAARPADLRALAMLALLPALLATLLLISP